MSYEAAMKLRNKLLSVGIDEVWTTTGGLSIQCFEHEKKKLARILNSFVDELDYVSLDVGFHSKRRTSYEAVRVVRVKNKPITFLKNS